MPFGNAIEWKVALDEFLADGASWSEPFNCYVRMHQAGNAIIGGFQRIPASGTKVVKCRLVDGRRCYSPEQTTATMDPISFVFRAHNRPNLLPAEARQIFGGLSSSVGSLVPFGWSTSIMAWVRKRNAGDATHARFTMGMFDNTVISGSRGVPRAGLIGDGVTGFRFGSVNCPISPGLGAGDNAANDIDINAVQPPELVDPGANWFHARIKMIPGTPAVPNGKWEAYLNGRLAATFADTTNWPQGVLGNNFSFTRIEPTIACYADLSVVIPAPVLHDIRVWWEEL